MNALVEEALNYYLRKRIYFARENMFFYQGVNLPNYPCINKW